MTAKEKLISFQTILPEKMTLPDVEKRVKSEIKSSIADRRSMIELNSQSWKTKTVPTVSVLLGILLALIYVNKT